MGEIAFQVGFFLFFIILGYVAGTIAERRHWANLAEREASNGEFLVTQLKSFPAFVTGSTPPQLIVAESAIGSDYFKTFLAKVRGLFGGEVRSYQSLLDRARREATQRAIEQARQLGYNALCNLRLDSADIGGNSKSSKGIAMVTIIASATAYHFHAPAS